MAHFNFNTELTDLEVRARKGANKLTAPSGSTEIAFRAIVQLFAIDAAYSALTARQVEDRIIANGLFFPPSDSSERVQKALTSLVRKGFLTSYTRNLVSGKKRVYEVDFNKN